MHEPTEGAGAFGTSTGVGREPGLLKEVLKRALSQGAEYGDLFVEDRIVLGLRLEDGRIEPPVFGHDGGAGIRLIHTGITQYVTTGELGEEGLIGAVDALLRGDVPPSHHHVIPSAVAEPLPHPWVDAVEAMAGMRAAEKAARAADPSVFQVVVSYRYVRQRIQVLTSRDPYAHETRTDTTFTVRVFARRNGRTAEGTSGMGGSGGSPDLDEGEAARIGSEAAEVAVSMLDAGPAPAGEQTVVLTSGWGGVLFHEACGHALEADFVQRGSSYLAGLRGKRVAAEGVTLVDDPTRPGMRGSYAVDDEGVAAEPTAVIEEGILRNYLYDVRSALKEGTASTGNGRRESYRDLPLPRMSNIVMQPGPYDPKEIVENTQSGVFVASMGGGSVDLGSGDFVFSVTEGYRIEQGKLGRPIQGATLVGRAPEVLREIDMVGDDLRFDPGYSACAKEGQKVPAGVGQPTLRVPKLIVGGTDY